MHFLFISLNTSAIEVNSSGRKILYEQSDIHSMNFEAFIYAIIFNFFSPSHSFFYMMIDDDSLWVCETLSLWKWCGKEWKVFHFFLRIFFIVRKRWERNKSFSLQFSSLTHSRGNMCETKPNFYWESWSVFYESMYLNKHEINCSWKCILALIQGQKRKILRFNFFDSISWKSFMLIFDEITKKDDLKLWVKKNNFKFSAATFKFFNKIFLIFSHKISLHNF